MVRTDSGVRADEGGFGAADVPDPELDPGVVECGPVVATQLGDERTDHGRHQHERDGYGDER
jgi:hypothetical protein